MGWPWVMGEGFGSALAERLAGGDTRGTGGRVVNGSRL